MTNYDSCTSSEQRHVAWLERRTLFQGILAALAWAALTGLLAQVRIPLPFTPVPFTMQVFAFLLGGVVLGMRFGVLAQVLYVALGVAGVPWFQGAHGGPAYFLGPTGGYLLAAPFAALCAAVAAKAHRFGPVTRAFFGMLAGVVVIYAMGVTWLAFALGITFAKAFVLGALPFIALDLGKVALATALARPFVPR